MLKLFDRYVIREIFPPSVVGLLLCTFVLLMNQILLLAELFIHKGVPFGTAAETLLLLVPSILAFAVPMSVLMGILGGLSRLSTDSEIVAFKTLGVPLSRFLKPALIFASGGWLVASVLALYIAPRANDSWVRKMTSSVLGRAQIRIRAMEFNESIPNTVLFIQNILKDKTWENVFVFSNKDPLEPRIILARRGGIHFYPEQKRATLELFNGALHSGPVSAPEEYRITSFRRLEEEIDVENLFSAVSSEKRVREKDIRELFLGARVIRKELGVLEKSSRDENAAPAAVHEYGRKLREFRSHQVEIHKKFALPLTCLIFVLVGLPLGTISGRGGRTSGFTISLGIILSYYLLITSGEKMAIDGKITASLGMWGPDVLLAAAGFWLWFVSRKGTGISLRPIPRLFKGKERKKEGSDFPPEPRRRKLVRYSLRFPNILDRYISRKYIALFSLVACTLVSFSALALFFERLDDVFRHNKPLGLLLRYLWFRMPEIIFFILPVTALTASLLCLGLLSKFNEVTAMKAAGISLHRLIAPVIVLALAVGGVSFLIQDRLLPAANIRAEETWNEISDLPPRSYSFLNRHWILGRQKDRIYHYEFFDASSSAFRRLSVFDIDLSGWALERRVFADKATFGENRLVVQNGWIREFSESGIRPLLVEEEWDSEIPESKSYFLKEWKEPSQMTYGELRIYTKEVREMGFEATRLRVDLGTKIAFPLVSLIMTFLAVPFAFTLGRRGALVGVGLSVVIAAFYWGTVAVFRSLGYVGFLTPFLAAWGPHFIFGLAGIYFIFRLRS